MGDVPAACEESLRPELFGKSCTARRWQNGLVCAAFLPHGKSEDIFVYGFVKRSENCNVNSHREFTNQEE